MVADIVIVKGSKTLLNEATKIVTTFRPRRPSSNFLETEPVVLRSETLHWANTPPSEAARQLLGCNGEQLQSLLIQSLYLLMIDALRRLCTTFRHQVFLRAAVSYEQSDGYQPTVKGIPFDPSWGGVSCGTERNAEELGWHLESVFGT